VVGMDERQLALARERHRVQLGFVDLFAVQDDLGAEVARVLDLHARRVARHDDHRRSPQAAGVIRDALGVVAGRCRDDARRLLPAFEPLQLVERTALLERRGELMVLELEENLGPRRLRQGARVEARRLDDTAGNGGGGVSNAFDRDGGWGHGLIVYSGFGLRAAGWLSALGYRLQGCRFPAA